MPNLLLLELLEQVLGKSFLKKNGQEALFYCCFCHHYKPKLSVNLESGSYQCWVCNQRGMKVTSLLKKINRPDKIDEARKLMGETVTHKKDITVSTAMLPEEFISLTTVSRTPEYKQALRYILERNITTYDIFKYNIGYCSNGKYKGRIIIPSYDSNGMLNFFTGRSYYRNVWMPYLNPEISKDIIGFEVFINWREPIIITEGPMDAIAVKRNSIPLFGKRFSDALKIKMIQEKVKNLYIALDQDAILDSLDYCEEFLGYDMNVYLVDLTGKDPSKLGFVETWKLIDRTQPMDFKLLFAYRMKYGTSNRQH